MKTLKIDDKWSIEYDETANDAPVRVLRHGNEWDQWPYSMPNYVLAMFYALLEERRYNRFLKNAINQTYGKLPESSKNAANFTAQFLTNLAEQVHATNVKAGWWSDMHTGESTLHTRNVPEMLCLIHSEISEGMEGYRKDAMDDTLTHRPALQTELVDAMIRILDLAGSRMAIERDNDDEVHEFGTIFVEKRAYNAMRQDHRLERRKAAGGKAF